MSGKSEAGTALDLSRAPRGELVAAQLVAAVAVAGDLAERHYLELKGPSDLQSKVSKQKVAKFILGAANRMPERAAEAFEGYGVMIVGITKDGAVGVPPIEMLSLAQVIQPFLGAIGPRWDIVRIPVENSTNQVIVILVDPPEMGQSPYVCRASGESLVDGRIYYRADGETREPTSDELDQLMARGAAMPQLPVELEVRVTGKVMPVAVESERTLEEFIAMTRTELLDAIPATKAEPEPEQTSATPAGVENARAGTIADAIAREANRPWLSTSLAASAPSLGVLLGAEVPEKRTEEKYRAEIDNWEQRFRDAWPDAVDLYLAYAVETNEISVANKGRTFLPDVVVELHLEGAVERIEPEHASEDGPDWRDLKLPAPPRRWGPTKGAPLFGIGHQPNWAGLTPPYLTPPSFAPSSTSWKNGGSVDVSVAVGDLRPEATFESDDGESILIIRGSIPASVQGTWRATIRGYHDVFTGTMEAEVADSTALTDSLREFLEID